MPPTPTNGFLCLLTWHAWWKILCIPSGEKPEPEGRALQKTEEIGWTHSQLDPRSVSHILSVQTERVGHHPRIFIGSSPVFLSYPILSTTSVSSKGHWLVQSNSDWLGIRSNVWREIGDPTQLIHKVWSSPFSLQISNVRPRHGINWSLGFFFASSCCFYDCLDHKTYNRFPSNLQHFRDQTPFHPWDYPEVWVTSGKTRGSRRYISLSSNGSGRS